MSEERHLGVPLPAALTMAKTITSGSAALILSIAANRTVAWADAQPTAEAKVTSEAQAPESHRPPEPVRGPASAIAVPTRGLFDVLRELRHKPPRAEPAEDAHEKLMIAATPVVSYNPASGFEFGVAGNATFYKGSPQTTSLSSVVASLIVTSRKQRLLNGKVDVSTSENRWVLHGDNRVYFTSQDTYGLGTSTTPEDQIKTQYTFLRFYETGYRRVYRRLYLGASWSTAGR